MRNSRFMFLVAAPGCSPPDTIYGEMLRARSIPEFCNGQSRSESILVVDDDLHFRRALARALTSGCYEVVLADTAEEAMAQLGTRRIELVICDADGNGRTGLELVRACKQDPRLAHIPAIVLLSERGRHSWQDCQASGADNWVRKASTAIGEVVARGQALIENRKRVVSWCMAQLRRTSRERNWCIARQGLSATDSACLGRLEHVVEDRYRDPMFSVEDFARAMGRSRRGLQRLCRTVVGLTPMEIVRCARLATAGHMIEEGHAVKVAAAHAGFRDDSDFSRYFRVAFGLTAGRLKRHLSPERQR